MAAAAAVVVVARILRRRSGPAGVRGTDVPTPGWERVAGVALHTGLVVYLLMTLDRAMDGPSLTPADATPWQRNAFAALGKVIYAVLVAVIVIAWWRDVRDVPHSLNRFIARMFVGAPSGQDDATHR